MQQFGRDRVESGHRADIVDRSKMTRTGRSCDAGVIDAVWQRLNSSSIEITSSPVGEVIDTVVIGAGHAGLALSCYLLRNGTEHVVLEPGQVGERWRTERWDSLVFQFPNWSLQLPDRAYQGPDPDGYPSKDEFILFLEDYASGIRAPVRCNTEVFGLRDSEDSRSMDLATARGAIRARNVVVAIGPFQDPKRTLKIRMTARKKPVAVTNQSTAYPS
jgi:glycine/D-amino acid oxidase-like deaminating enzyme